DARIGLCLRLLHRLSESADHQYHAGSPGHVPLSVHLHHVLDVHFFGDGFLEEDRRMLRYGEERGVIVEWERGNNTAHADLKAALHFQFRVHACREIREELANGRSHALLLDADGRIAESRRELEGIDAVAVHDAVEVDVADVVFGSELYFHLLERGIEQLVGAAPEHRRAHLARGRTDVAGEELLVFEVYVERIDELLSVEERADRHLHTSHAPLQLELPDLVRKGFLVRLE